MSIAVPIAILIVVLCWVLAEVRFGRNERICVGLFLLSIVGWASYSIAKIVPRTEAYLHQRCFQHMGQLLERGDVAGVKLAVEAYNSAIAHDRRSSQAALDATSVMSNRSSLQQSR